MHTPYLYAQISTLQVGRSSVLGLRRAAQRAVRWPMRCIGLYLLLVARRTHASDRSADERKSYLPSPLTTQPLLRACPRMRLD